MVAVVRCLLANWQFFDTFLEFDAWFWVLKTLLNTLYST